MKRMLSMGMLSLLSAVLVYAAEKPNVVIILADDLGWMDIVSNAARVKKVKPEECFYETPHIGIAILIASAKITI